jgi:hypothetical protein
MSDGKLQPASHGIHHWLFQRINDLEKWANTSRPPQLRPALVP